jgi:hypothetical protein
VGTTIIEHALFDSHEPSAFKIFLSSEQYGAHSKPGVLSHHTMMTSLQEAHDHLGVVTLIISILQTKTLMHRVVV